MRLYEWHKDLLSEGELYRVGGAVRDELLGIAERGPDTDYMVRSIEAERLAAILKRHGSVQFVGKSFGVFKFVPRWSNQAVDIAFPRKEVSTGPGHKEFHVEYDPNLPVEEDLARRDFTINAMAQSLRDGSVIDPFGGREDLKRGIVRMVFREAFEEDPLRILRGVRFAARFGFVIDRQTEESMAAASKLLISLSPERVRDELDKMLTQSEAPSEGLEYLRKAGGLEVLLPELERGHGVTQNEFHPDDVYYHSLKSCDAVPKENLLVRWAALLHDLGKVDRKRIVHDPSLGRERVVFYGHQEVSAELARKILSRYRYPRNFISSCENLIMNHMFDYKPEWKPAAIRRFMSRVGEENIEDLFLLRKADSLSRGADEEVGELEELKRRIDEEIRARSALTVQKLAIDGKDVMETLSLGPGPEVGRILRDVLEIVIEDPSLNDREKLLGLLRERFEK